MRRIIAMCRFWRSSSRSGGGAFVLPVRARSHDEPFRPSTIHSLDQIAASNTLAAANRASQRTPPSLSSLEGTLGCSDTTATTSTRTRMHERLAIRPGRAIAERDPHAHQSHRSHNSVRTERLPQQGRSIQLRLRPSMEVTGSGPAAAGELRSARIRRSPALLGRIRRSRGGVRLRGLRVLRLLPVRSRRDEWPRGRPQRHLRVSLGQRRRQLDAPATPSCWTTDLATWAQRQGVDDRRHEPGQPVPGPRVRHVVAVQRRLLRVRHQRVAQRRPRRHLVGTSGDQRVRRGCVPSTSAGRPPGRAMRTSSPTCSRPRAALST